MLYCCGAYQKVQALRRWIGFSQFYFLVFTYHQQGEHKLELTLLLISKK